MTNTVSANASAPRQQTRPWATPRLAPALSVVVFIVAWQLIQPWLPTRQAPTPLDVGEFIVNELRGETISPYTVYQAFGLSLTRLVIGLAIAGVVGVALGVWMGTSRRAEAFFHDPVAAALAVPYLVFALLFAMWLGFGFWTPIVTAALSALPFVVINVAEGVRNVPKDLVDMARAYAVPQRRILRSVVIPSLIPFLFAAARYAVSLGWKSLALAELFGASNGAGWVLRYFYDAHRIGSLIGYAFFFVFLALILDLVLFKWLSGRLLRWQPKVSRTPAA